jgi:predicted MFS family arabinose efflux permease
LSIWRPAIAGAGAIGSGVGLARFAYVPLFPAMVGAGWVDGGGAGLLGAANFAGYLAGVLSGRSVAARTGIPRALDLGMALAAVAFAAMALDLGLGWFVLWRGLAGVAGGVLMALTGPAVQASMPEGARGAAGGVVMAGVGVGVVLASALVPLLLGAGGLPLAWGGLAVLVAAVWMWLRGWWPDPPRLAPAEASGAVPRAPWLLLAYGLSGAGMVAPMVYLADLAVRGRGLPVEGGALVWTLFGVGAGLGTILGGRVAGRIGGLRALPIWMGVQVGALGLALVPWWPALMLSGLANGFAGVGATAVALAAARNLAGPRAGVIWVRATAGYAVAQAGTAFALAALFAATGERHAVVFGAGLVLSILALGASLRR